MSDPISNYLAYAQTSTTRFAGSSSVKREDGISSEELRNSTKGTNKDQTSTEVVAEESSVSEVEDIDFSVLAMEDISSQDDYSSASSSRGSFVDISV